MSYSAFGTGRSRKVAARMWPSHGRARDCDGSRCYRLRRERTGNDPRLGLPTGYADSFRARAGGASCVMSGLGDVATRLTLPSDSSAAGA